MLQEKDAGGEKESHESQPKQTAVRIRPHYHHVNQLILMSHQLFLS